MSYWQIISFCLCLDIHLFCLLWSIYQRLLALLLLSSFQGCSICFTAKAVRFRRWIRITQYPTWAQSKTNCGLWNNRSATFKRILKKLHFQRRVIYIYHLSYEKNFFLFIYHKYGKVKFYKRDKTHHSTVHCCFVLFFFGGGALFYRRILYDRYFRKIYVYIAQIKNEHSTFSLKVD